MLDKSITPIKCALSALKDKGDVFTTPNTQARKNAQKDFGKDSRLEVLQITSSLSVANLKELVEAVRERCVDSGDDGEKVLKNMEFMTNVDKVSSKKTLLAMLSRLLDLALKSVSKFDFTWLGLEGETVPFQKRKKILAALADRAVDLAVITELNGAGLGAEEEPDWAGSAFAAAFPSSSGKPVPDLVMPYLEANGECVFGDCWGSRLSKRARRLSQRILHRVMAAKMARVPTKGEVQELLDAYLSAGRDVGTVDEFQAVVKAFLDLGNASTGEAWNDRDGPGSSSDGGLTGNGLGGGTSSDTGVTGDELSEWSPGFASWKEMPSEQLFDLLVRRHASLEPLRDSWRISGPDVTSCDGKLAALAEDKGVPIFQLTGVVTALSSLTIHYSPTGPARKKAKWDIQLAGKPLGDFGAAAAEKAADIAMHGSGPREIKVVGKEELMEYLETKAVRMNETKDFTLLGFCKGGLDEGPYCRKFLELLEAGGKDAQWLVNQRAVSLVIREAKAVIKVRGKDSDPTLIQAAHLIWLSKQAKDLTPLNPTYRETGMTHDHRDDVVTKAVVGASGGIEGEQVEKDRRKSKNIDSYGFTCTNIRRLKEMMQVVHGRTFSRNFFMDFDQLLDEVKIKCDGHGEVMLAVDEVTKLVWAELPEKVKTSIDGAVRAGTSAGEAICRHLDLTPRNWATTGKAELLLDTVLTQLRAAGRTLQRQQQQQQQGRKRGAGDSAAGSGGGESEEGEKDEDDERDHEDEEGGGYEGYSFGGEMEEGGVDEEGEDDDVEEVHGRVSRAAVDATSDLDPRWESFSSSLKEWCDSHGYRSLRSAKKAWLEDGHMGQCFFDCSELGKMMGGCMEQERCRFASSHD